MLFGLTVKAFIIWLGILCLAMDNGIFRESILIPAIGKPLGLLSSGILLSLLILLVAYLSLPWFGQVSRIQTIIIGIISLCLTLIFEFTFGLYQGKTWLELFEAYLFKDWNIWPLVLLVTAVAPYLTAKLRTWF